MDRQQPEPPRRVKLPEGPPPSFTAAQLLAFEKAENDAKAEKDAKEKDEHKKKKNKHADGVTLEELLKDSTKKDKKDKKYRKEEEKLQRALANPVSSVDGKAAQ